MNTIMFTLSIIFLVLLSIEINVYSISEKDSVSLNYYDCSIDIPSDIYEWSDGSFNGYWRNEGSEEEGDFNGYLKLGRRPDIGIFFGDWWYLDDVDIGDFEGLYIKNFVFGKLIFNDSSSGSFIFIGMLSFINDTNFEASLYVSNVGKIKLNGQYKYSFLPDLTGLYSVGVKKFHLIDKDRYEGFTVDDPYDYRELMIQIWYPIRNDTKGERIDYMDFVTFEWLMQRSPIPLLTIPDSAYEYVHPHGFIEVPINIEDESFPILIFSPGYDGNYEIYTSLIEDLVSNGFIVVSMNHPYVSGITVFPDGRKIKASPVINISLPTVVGDAVFVMDYLEEINAEDEILKDRLDLSKVGMFGHSFGGAATLICCQEDDRFKAGLTLDGVIYDEIINENFDKPFMIMLAENSFSYNMSNYLWGNLDSDAFRVIIDGSTHYAFTDVGLLLKHLLPLVPREFLGFGTIEPKRMVNITKSFELAFFKVYLKDFSSDILINLSYIFDEVYFEYKE